MPQWISQTSVKVVGGSKAALSTAKMGDKKQDLLETVNTEEQPLFVVGWDLRGPSPVWPARLLGSLFV